MKINKQSVFILLGLIFTIITSCKKESTEAILNLKVLDPNNNPAAAIEFQILEHNGEYFQPLGRIVSSSNGETSITLTKTKSFYLYLIPQERYMDWYMGNSAAQLFNTGLFKSLEEINYSPRQRPTPVVGDIKYADINADAIISPEDLVWKLDLQDDTQITVNLVAGKMLLHR